MLGPTCLSSALDADQFGGQIPLGRILPLAPAAFSGVDRWTADKRSHDVSAAGYPLLVIEVAVFRSDGGDVGGVVGLIGSEDGEVGVEEHRGVDVGRIGVVLGAFDHRNDAVDAILGPCQLREIAACQAATRSLVGRGFRLVDRVVVHRCGDNGIEVVDGFLHSEVSYVPYDVVDMFEAVVSPMLLTMTRRESIEQLGVRADVLLPGLEECVGHVTSVAAHEDVAHSAP
jgi:hypothetical protein